MGWTGVERSQPMSDMAPTVKTTVVMLRIDPTPFVSVTRG